MIQLQKNFAPIVTGANVLHDIHTYVPTLLLALVCEQFFWSLVIGGVIYNFCVCKLNQESIDYPGFT